MRPSLFVFLSLVELVNGDLLAVLAVTLELDGAVHQGEQGVVLALADVGAGVDLGAALTDEDVAGEDELPVGPLGSEALGLAVAAVLVTPPMS